MKAVITVIGKDTVGILARVSAVCAQCEVNISEVTQTVLEDLFCMIMMCDTARLNVPFDDFSRQLSEAGRDMGLSVNVMHEDIFNAMHRI